MQVLTPLTFLAGLTIAAGAVVQPSTGPVPDLHLAADYGKLPLSFEANQGQADGQVRFLSHGNGYGLFLTDSAAVLTLTKPASPTKSRRTDVLRMQIAGAHVHALAVTGQDQLPGIVSYFTGKDSSQWRTNIPTYARVKYSSVYPGIDLVYYGNQRQLEYDFVVAPQANPKQIRLHFDGAKKLELTPSGDLQVIAGNGEIAFHKPVVYQIENGQRQTVQGSFQLSAKNTLTFKVDNYDHNRELVIDPTLAYSTYLGGTYSASSSMGVAIAADSSGDSYVVGSAGGSNADFPVTSGAFETNTVNEDSFVTKFNATGTELIYSTYFEETVEAIAVDSDGNAYLTGESENPGIAATSGAFQSTCNGYCAFAAKLNATGSALSYLTYLGGSSGSGTSASGRAIAVDSQGYAYIAGDATTTNYPVTSGAFQTKNNAANGPFTVYGGNAVITKINTTGTALVYSTYLGGAETDALGIAVDDSGDAYVTGVNISYDGSGYVAVFPTTQGSFDPGELPGSAATVNEVFGSYVTKLNPTGTGLVYSTFLGDLYLEDSGNEGYNAVGGPGNTNAIAIDSDGNAYVTGTTGYANFPITTGAFQTVNKGVTSQGGSNAFVTKLNASGSALVYSTYLGGSKTSNGNGVTDTGNSIAVDSAGDAYVAGTADSTNFPVTSNAYQPANKAAAVGATNGFVTEVNPTGSALVYSTYLGGSDANFSDEGYEDAATGIALDGLGGAYITGVAASTNFPTTSGVFQQSLPNDNEAAFVSKFDLGSSSETPAATPAFSPKPGTYTAAQTVTITDATSGATIYYTTNGTTPTPSSTKYTAPITVSSTETIEAIATAPGYTESAVASGTYVIQPATTPASIAVVSGSGQTTVYGSAFADPLVVIVKDASGDAVPNATVTFSGTGLKFSSTTATTGSNGEASVTATATASGTLTAKASVSGVSAAASFTLTATKAVLTVTATSITVKYDVAIPTLTYAVTGYVNGDTSSVVTGAPTETTTATKGSTPGSYPITLAAGSLKATNYTFTLVNGTVTITPLGTVKSPTYSPAAGTYTTNQTVSIADATSGATIHYTTDGSAPTTSSTVYTGPISITKTTVVKALAAEAGYTTSGIATAIYTIDK